MAYNDNDELLDLDLSHEPKAVASAPTTTTAANNNNNNSLYPAFQSIDDVVGNAYSSGGNAYDENAPMLGQVTPQSPKNDKIDSNAAMIAVSAPNPGINNNVNKQSNYGSNDQSTKTSKCWQIEYYRPYFDVDTMSLLGRLKKTIIPTSIFLDPDMNEKPDLYGPFWIVSTLVFLMAAMGNLSRFLNREESNTSEWENDIKKISEAASMLYTVSTIIPLFLYFLFRNWNCERGFIELITIYGYSLFPFVPACILCVVPWELFQWGIVFVSFGISLWFLIRNLYKPLTEEKRATPGYYVLGTVIIIQFAISLALKIYFFQY